MTPKYAPLKYGLLGAGENQGPTDSERAVYLLFNGLKEFG